MRSVTRMGSPATGMMHIFEKFCERIRFSGAQVLLHTNLASENNYND